MDRTLATIESFLSHPILWGVFALVALSIALSGKLSISASSVILWIAYGAAIFGVFRAEVSLKNDPALRYLILATIAGCLAVGALLLQRWLDPRVAAATSAVTDKQAPTKKTSLAPFELPYAFAESVGFVNNDLQVQVFYHNSGKTPAFNFQLTSRFLMTNESSYLDVVRAQDLAKPSGTGVLPPGGRVTNLLETQKENHSQRFQEAKRGGEWHIYVLGYLTYADSDGTTYAPRFCFMWSVRDAAFVQCHPNRFLGGEAIDASGSRFLGVHKTTETFIVPPGAGAIVGDHVSPDDVAGSRKLAAEGDKARARLTGDPDKLTLHDLFLTDFASSDTKYQTGFTLRNDQTGAETHIEWIAAWKLETGNELLLIYVPFTVETHGLCIAVADRYKDLLKEAHAPEVTQKSPGDSNTLSSKTLVFSNRIFVYHENNMSIAEIADLTKVYESRGVTIVLRSTDYLQNKKLEEKLKRLQK